MKGHVEFPAGSGRWVSPFSGEYRAHLKATRGAKPKAPKAKAATIEDVPDFASFEPPEHSGGEPKSVDGNKSNQPPPRKPTASEKAKDKADDVSDLCDIFATLYSGIAVLTQFQGWQISREEAEAHARPAQRILARHKHLEKSVRSIADPLALLGAVFVSAGTRFAMWRQERNMKRVSQAVDAPVTNVNTGARAPSPPPSSPGRPPSASSARIDDVIARISTLE